MRRKAVVLMVLMAFVLVACSTTKPLSSKAQATLFMNTYKMENLDLQSLSKMKNTTPAQKEMFKAKQAVLAKINPLLDIYVKVIDAGGIPDPSLQSSLNDLINQLVAAGGVH